MQSRHVRFYLLLCAIALATLIPDIVLGASQYIEYDGYWHIFTATQNLWAMFIAEWMADAHPPLYYYLLRAVARHGHSHLIYRSVSIVPMVFCVYAVGLVARKLYRSEWIALLAAAAYGFSITIIDVACEVRSYALALCFIVWAFYFFLDFVEARSTGKLYLSAVLFGLFSALAIFSEYYSVFFFAGCFVLLPILLLRDSVTRAAWVTNWTRHLLALLAGSALPIYLTRYLFRRHVRTQIIAYGHLSGYYWTPGTSIVDFLQRNTINELNYLLPFEIEGTVALWVFLIVALPVLLLFIFRKKILANRLTSTTPGLMLLVLTAGLIALALTGRYPYGGALRQQSILAPFFVLTGFLLLDSLVVRLSSVWKSAALLSTAVLIAANFAYQWREYPKIPIELFTDPYQTFRSKLPPAQAVYLDQYSQIAYFSETYTWKWKIKNRYPPPERFDDYSTVSPSGEEIDALRKTNENFDLLNIQFYQVLASSLRVVGLRTINLFQVQPNPTGMDSDTVQKNETVIRNLAGQCGLSVGPMVYSGSEALIAFALK